MSWQDEFAKQQDVLVKSSKFDVLFKWWKEPPRTRGTINAPWGTKAAFDWQTNGWPAARARLGNYTWKSVGGSSFRFRRELSVHITN